MTKSSQNCASNLTASSNTELANDAAGHAPAVKTGVSFDQAVRDTSFESFGNFPASFQVKHDDDDVREGMVILRSLLPDKNFIVR